MKKYNEKILIVDDRPENLFALESILKDFHVDIIKANSGNEALRKTLEHEFLLALVDVQMPEMDGYETVKLMRQTKQTEKLPVIFVSAIHNEQHYLEQGIDSGAVDFIVKPINPKLLKGKVKVFIDLYRQRKELEYTILQQTKTEQALKQAEIQLTIAKEKAEEADKLKSEFLANMSHEIRTPLNAILGFSELFAKENLNDETKEIYRRYINRSSNLLLNLVNDIIDISKIEAGKINIEFKNESINDILDELYFSVQKYIEQKDKKSLKLLLSNPVASQNLTLSLDANRFRQVFINLLTNAVKFTLNGEIVFGINKATKTDITFFVKDTGIGIPSEKLDTIFNKFNQVESNKVMHVESTGLGLYISKKLIDLMKGEIWVESGINEGTTFYFSIPNQAKDEFTQKKPPKKRKKNQSKMDVPLSRNINVLVVEDEPINFMLLNEILIKQGINSTWAKNGKQAIDKFTSDETFDAILMDIKMPLMNGYEAIKEIRKLDKTIPVIAQTAYAMSEDRKTAMNLGFNDYISKPIKAEILLEKLGRLLEKTVEKC
ncbi:MAG: response regulator [Bacteroidales bacterium]|nr:response regulator [Bacteroidales bacterium]